MQRCFDQILYLHCLSVKIHVPSIWDSSVVSNHANLRRVQTAQLEMLCCVYTFSCECLMYAHISLSPGALRGPSLVPPAVRACTVMWYSVCPISPPTTALVERVE